MVLVSHDRYFLDKAVDRVWELRADGISRYRGGYSAFAEQRLAGRARQQTLYERQQADIAKQEDYIRRNIAGQNTRQAQGRRTRLERLKAEGAIQAPISEEEIGVQLQAGDRGGDIVLRTSQLAIGHDGRRLFGVPDLVLRRGVCAAVIGPNGCGKTTFLQTLLEELPAADRASMLGGAALEFLGVGGARFDR